MASHHPSTRYGIAAIAALQVATGLFSACSDDSSSSAVGGAAAVGGVPGLAGAAAGQPSAGAAGAPSAGVPSAGAAPAGMPSAGTSGVPAAGAAGGAGVSGGAAAGAPAAGTPAAGTPATGGAPAAGSVAPPTAACALTADRLRITEVDVGAAVLNDEDEAALRPLAVSPIPSGGARLAWMGGDGMVHVTTLDAGDQPTGEAVALPAHDFGDVYADDAGGVLLLTRDAEGGGTLNCGEPTNLCGTPPSPPIPCFDMYMVRFDGTSETWATKLTDSSATLPPYSTGRDGPRVTMIWWYAHHGRIASDGARFAGYFGSAISVSEGGCINIHQGDRMKVVDAGGSIVQGAGFDWGCSHSGYERVVWDDRSGEFVAVCKTDNQNRIAIAPRYATIRPVDLAASNLGDVVLADGGGYWLIASDARTGESGMADVHLLRFTDGTAEDDIVLASPPGLNARAPHLSAYGSDGLLAAWETTPSPGDIRRNDGMRRLQLQVRDRATGGAVGDPVQVEGVLGNRYQELRAFPDGSAAFPAPGTGPSSVKILRVLPCGS